MSFNWGGGGSKEVVANITRMAFKMTQFKEGFRKCYSQVLNLEQHFL